MIGKRRKRIRMHLLDERGSQLPSIEGMLQHRGKEYEIIAPKLLFSAGGNPDTLDARYIVIPRERIAFYEVIG